MKRILSPQERDELKARHRLERDIPLLVQENGGLFEKINEERSKALFEHLNQHV